MKNIPSTQIELKSLTASKPNWWSVLRSIGYTAKTQPMKILHLQNENLKRLKSMSDSDKIDLINFLTNFKDGVNSENSIVIISLSGKRINISASNYCKHKELFEKSKNRKNFPYRRELLEDGTEVCHVCSLPFNNK